MPKEQTTIKDMIASVQRIIRQLDVLSTLTREAEQNPDEAERQQLRKQNRETMVRMETELWEIVQRATVLQVLPTVIAERMDQVNRKAQLLRELPKHGER